MPSTTDPDARLYRKGKGKETKLCFIGHGLMENRHGLLVDACLTQADGHAERVAALHMIEPRADRPTAITLGADKAYDAEDFVNELRSMNVTPHVAQNTSGRSSAIDGRTTRHGGYAVSQRIRKRIEEAFGWIKTVAGQEKTSFRGRDRVAWAFTFAATAYNLVRLPKLIAETGSWPRCPASPRPLSAAGASSRWTSGTATSSILSKRHISPSRASPMAKSPSELSRASWTYATAPATVRLAPSSHGRGRRQ
jgi:Transposase DDE domain